MRLRYNIIVTRCTRHNFKVRRRSIRPNSFRWLINFWRRSQILLSKPLGLTADFTFPNYSNGEIIFTSSLQMPRYFIYTIGSIVAWHPRLWTFRANFREHRRGCCIYSSRRFRSWIMSAFFRRLCPRRVAVGRGPRYVGLILNIGQKWGSLHGVSCRLWRPRDWWSVRRALRPFA